MESLYTLYVERGDWVATDTYSLSDSEIKGIYSARMLENDMGMRCFGHRFCELLLLSGTTITDFPTDTVEANAYNTRLENLLCFCTIRLTKFHSITTDINGNIVNSYDNDPFEYAISLYQEHVGGRIMIKIVASDLNKFLDGFLTYFRWSYACFGSGKTYSFDIWRKQNNKIVYFTTVTTLFSFLYNDLPLELQFMILTHLPKEFRYVSKYYNNLTTMEHPPCSLVPWLTVQKEIIRRLNVIHSIEGPYTMSRIINLIPKKLILTCEDTDLSFLATIASMDENVFSHLLKQIPDLRSKGYGSALFRKLNDDCRSRKTDQNQKRSIKLSIADLLRRSDFILNPEEIISVLDNASVMTIIDAFNAGKIDPTSIDITDANNAVLMALTNYPDFNPGPNTRAFLDRIIQLGDIGLLSDAFKCKNINPSIDNNYYLQMASANPADSTWGKILVILLQNTRVDLTSDNYELLNTIAKNVKDGSDAHIFVHALFERGMINNGPLISTWIENRRIMDSVMQYLTDVPTLAYLLRIKPDLNISQMRSKIIDNSLQCPELALSLLMNPTSRNSYQSALILALIAADEWKNLEMFLTTTNNKLTLQSEKVLQADPRGRRLLELYNAKQ